DFPVPPSACSGSTCPQPAIVNQQSAAILDQQSAAILDQNPKYTAFGHGTMVMGVIHLVAPQAKLLPLKAFNSDGTGYLSDILRAIYYAVQNNAKIVNMSFEFKVSSPDPELIGIGDCGLQLGVRGAYFELKAHIHDFGVVLDSVVDGPQDIGEVAGAV